MKKALLIGVAAMVVVAALFLTRNFSEQSVGIEESAVVEVPLVSAIQQDGNPSSPDTRHLPALRSLGEAGTLTTRSSRIPLPSPELPAPNHGLVPAYLHPLFGWKDIGGYVPRRRLVEAIDHELLPNEIRALLMFVRSQPEDVGLSDDDFNGVGDVVLLKLEEQKQLHPDYTDHLAVMFYDESLNAIWRDYCIQHLGTVYQRIPADKRPLINQLYEDALESGSQFAGTTLISMKRSAGTSDMPELFVAERAFDVASSSAYSDAERLSALHVAATFNHPEAIELAREIAVSKRSTTFRAASLAVIGLNGDASDQPLLEKYVNSSDIRLRVAAAEALKNLIRE